MLARRPKVLVIDDSETILDFTRAALEDAGYDVVTLTSAALFPTTLNREKPDLALIDVAMPVIDGQSLVSLARRNQLHRCLIALYSGQPEETLKAMTAACGADGYIRKSSDVQVLLRHVERLLLPAAAPVATAGVERSLPAKASRDEGEVVLIAPGSTAAAPAELEQAIRAGGCSPVLCRSRGELLEALDRRAPLACLIDLAFDGRHGDALCQTVKSRPPHARVPVILLGAESSREVASSWRAGADDFLPSPAKGELLAGKLDRLRAARRAPPSAPRDRSRQALLLVEASAAQRERLGANLEVSGYGLLPARSAAEALRLLDLHAAAVGVAVVNLDGEEADWRSLLPLLRRRFQGPLVALTAREELARPLRGAGLDPLVLASSQLPLEQLIKRINGTVHSVPADLQPHLRVPHFSVAQFRPSCSQAWRSGITYDLSPAGVFLRTLTPEPKGTLLDLELQLTAFGARTACAGVVAWSNPFADRAPFSYAVGMGVQLVGLSPDVSAGIARIVRAVDRGGAAARLPAL